MNHKQVREAEVEDIPGIISILQQNLISNKKETNSELLAKTGFLINPFSFEDAKSAITDIDNFIFLVSIENSEVIGYTVACNVQKLNADFQKELSTASLEVRNIIASEKSLYLRHIAKKTDVAGVGKELLKKLFETSNKQNYTAIICVIAEKPIQNKASKKFHEKNGFACMGYYQSEKKIFGIYLKKLS